MFGTMSESKIPDRNSVNASSLPAAETKNIIFNYAAQNDAAAINDVSFQVHRGECLLLTGLSGCGKTTILRVLNGLIPNYYEGQLLGSVKLWGEPIAGKPIYDISKQVATVFQNPKSQFFNLDTTSEILFFLENMGTPFETMQKRLSDVASFLHIEHLLDRNIFNLSGGEKQMIAIASALASDTDIIVLDEPTSNLDVHYIEKIAGALRLLKQAGKTLIISEHRLYFLRDIIDRAFVIKAGKIIHNFTQKEFIELSEENRKSLLLRPITMNCSVFERANDSFFTKNTPLHKEVQQLTIKELRYRFPKDHTDFLSVQNVSMMFGKVIALTGKNGQGKSTFAQCLTGLLRAKEDTMLLNGNKLTAKKRLELSYMVLQDVGYQLFTESVEDEIALGKNKIRKAVQHTETSGSAVGAAFATETILELMHLTALKDRHPLSVSAGQKQRVSIGAAVSSGASIIIMDEPTSGMDYFHMKETAKLINEIRSPEKIIIIISHDFEFLSLTADEIMVMEKGSIVSHSEFTKEKAEEVFDYLKN